MLDEKNLVEFCKKLNVCWKRNPDAAFDVIGLLDDLLDNHADQKFIEETVKTILEAVEPDRIGELVTRKNAATARAPVPAPPPPAPSATGNPS